MCEKEVTVLSLLQEALALAKTGETVAYSNDREEEALINAIERALGCARNVRINNV